MKPRKTFSSNVIAGFSLLTMVLMLSIIRSETQFQQEVVVDPGDLIDAALQLQKEWIEEEMKSLKKEEATTTKNVVIVSTWRSGSSFLGGLFETYPGMMYIYEPLQDFEDAIVRKEADQVTAVRRLEKLLQCDFTNETSFLEHEEEHGISFPRSSKLWHWCKQEGFPCYSPTFLNQFCSLSKTKTLKVVRAPLGMLEYHLKENLIDKLVYLVRDPRGSLSSRKRVEWCRRPDCSQADRVCQDLEDDYDKFMELKAKYPEKIIAVRYEDFTKEPLKMAKKVMSWANLHWNENQENYILMRTSRTIRGSNPYSTYRNGLATQTWRQQGFPFIEEIQERCTDAMKLWGYRTFNLTKELGNANIRSYVPLEHIVMQ